MNRKSHEKCLFLLLGTLVLPITALAEEPVRKMGVNIGPERVFERPVVELIPELKGAVATHVNGRVGNELVFWGYRLGNGKSVQLFACTELNGTNCQSRIQLICEKGSGTVLGSVMEPGSVVKRDCNAVADAHVGDMHPGCTDKEIENNLLVGLVTCPGN